MKNALQFLEEVVDVLSLIPQERLQQSTGDSVEVQNCAAGAIFGKDL